MLKGTAFRRPIRCFSLPPQQTVIGRRGAKRATLAASERLRMRLHVEQTPLGVIEWNLAFEVTAWNPAAERIFGYCAAEAIGRHGLDLIVPPHLTPHIVSEIWGKLLARRGGGERSINENVTKTGAVLWCDWYNTPLIDAKNKVVGVASLVLDITQQVAAEREREAALLALKQSEERFRLMTEHASDLVSILDEEGVIRYHSEAVRPLLGYEPAELVGTAPIHLVHEEDLPRLSAALGPGRIASHAASEPVTYRFRHKNGEWRWIESIATNLVSHPGVSGLLVNSRDITERVQASEKLQWQAHHDSLTGLPNRVRFMTQAEILLRTARRRRQKAALLFIDLDRFKWVNDTMGHDAGDAVLQEVARRLQAVLPPPALLARLSGDEFVILLPRIVRIHEAAQAARRLLHALSSPPFRYGERETVVGASVGVAVFPRDGTSVELLLKSADTAMYRAKEHAAENVNAQKSMVSVSAAATGGAYQFFTPEMDTEARERQSFAAALRRALRGSSGGGEFFLVFQPIVSGSNGDSSDGAWRGAEALLRWRHPDLGIIGPDKFLEVVRDNGLTEPLNRWVLREVCRTLARWRERGVFLPIWVNIAVAQSLDTAAAVLVQQVEAALAEFHVPSEMLVLEVTPAMVADVLAVGTLRTLKKCGVGLALDDFGTGYSSLAALRQFPLTALKIDRALVQSMTDSPEEAALLRAVIHMAHALHFSVVAEGVETPAQQTELREMNCDLIQGYHIRRPMSAQDVVYALMPDMSDTAPSLVSSFPPGPPTRHKFSLKGYNKQKYPALSTSAAQKG